MSSAVIGESQAYRRTVCVGPGETIILCLRQYLQTTYRAAVHGLNMVSLPADPKNFLFCCNVVVPFPTSSVSRIYNDTVGSFFHYFIILAHSYNCRYSLAYGHHLYIAEIFNIYRSDSSNPSKVIVIICISTWVLLFSLDFVISRINTFWIKLLGTRLTHFLFLILLEPKIRWTKYDRKWLRWHKNNTTELLKFFIFNIYLQKL